MSVIIYKDEIKCKAKMYILGMINSSGFLTIITARRRSGVVKLRFAGAVCSPNPNLRPTDVIASLFAENLQPRLTTKTRRTFFKFFMGLWDEMFVEIKTNTLKLPEFSGNKNDTKELAELCQSRADQIEFGFVEGFWGGCDTLSIPNYAAELMASLSDMADVYGVLAKKLTQAENPKDIYPVILNTDQMVEKTFRFLIEHIDFAAH